MGKGKAEMHGSIKTGKMSKSEKEGREKGTRGQASFEGRGLGFLHAGKCGA